MFCKATEKDWKEDFHLENGMYQNNCRSCGKLFIGHKGRIICKVCDVKKPFTFAKIRKLFKFPRIPIILTVIAISLNIVWFSQFGRYVEIKQKVTKKDYEKGILKVETEVWVRDWKRYAEALPYMGFVNCTTSQLDSVKKAEMKKAVVSYNKVLKNIKVFDDIEGLE